METTNEQIEQAVAYFGQDLDNGDLGEIIQRFKALKEKTGAPDSGAEWVNLRKDTQRLLDQLSSNEVEVQLSTEQQLEMERGVTKLIDAALGAGNTAKRASRRRMSQQI